MHFISLCPFVSGFFSCALHSAYKVRAHFILAVRYSIVRIRHDLWVLPADDGLPACNFKFWVANSAAINILVCAFATSGVGNRADILRNLTCARILFWHVHSHLWSRVKSKDLQCSGCAASFLGATAVRMRVMRFPWQKTECGLTLSMMTVGFRRGWHLHRKNCILRPIFFQFLIHSSKLKVQIVLRGKSLLTYWSYRQHS